MVLCFRPAVNRIGSFADLHGQNVGAIVGRQFCQYLNLLKSRILRRNDLSNFILLNGRRLLIAGFRTLPHGNGNHVFRLAIV